MPTKALSRHFFAFFRTPPHKKKCQTTLGRRLAFFFNDARVGSVVFAFFFKRMMLVQFKKKNDSYWQGEKIEL